MAWFIVKYSEHMSQDQEQDKDDHSSSSTQYFTELLAGINKVGIERNLKMSIHRE